MLPLVSREWRVAARSRAYVSGRAILVSVGLAGWTLYFYGQGKVPASAVGRQLLSVLIFAGVFVALIGTAYSMAAVIRREQRQHTLEVLAMADIGLGPALIQKLIGGITLRLASLAACLPLLVITISLGGIGPLNILYAVLAVTLCVILGAGIGTVAGLIGGAYVFLTTTCLLILPVLANLCYIGVPQSGWRRHGVIGLSAIIWANHMPLEGSTVGDFFAGVICYLGPSLLLFGFAWWQGGRVRASELAVEQPPGWRRARRSLRAGFMEFFECDLSPWWRTAGKVRHEPSPGVWQQLASQPVGDHHPITWHEYYRPGGDLRYWGIAAVICSFVLVVGLAIGDGSVASAGGGIVIIVTAVCWLVGNSAMRYEQSSTLPVLLGSPMSPGEILRHKQEAAYGICLPWLLGAEVFLAAAFGGSLPRSQDDFWTFTVIVFLSGAGFIAGLLCYPLKLLKSRSAALLLLVLILTLDFAAILYLNGAMAMPIARVVTAIAIPFALWGYLSFLGRGWLFTIMGGALAAAAAPCLAAIWSIEADRGRYAFINAEWAVAAVLPLMAVNLAALGQYLSLRIGRNVAWLVALLGVPLCCLAIGDGAPTDAPGQRFVLLLSGNLLLGPVLWQLVYDRFPSLVERHLRHA